MVKEVFSALKKELIEVERRVRRELIVKGQDRKPFFVCQVPYLDWNIRPALVTGVARLYNFYCERVITLAVIVQLIYLAGVMHVGVADEAWSAGRDPDNVQWPVLLGDYLYSRFFALACEADMIDFIEPLAETVCFSNQVGIQCHQWKGTATDRLLSQVEGETASLVAVACRLAGKLAAAPIDDLTHLERFGWNFGMGYGIQKYDLTGLAQSYFARAANALDLLPPGAARNILAGIVELLSSRCSNKVVTGLEG